MSRSDIEWTEETWNPVTGCTKVSLGCQNCYAERFAKRLHAMGNPRYRNEFELTLHPDKVGQPHKWRKPRLVFVNSMSDLFHGDVPEDFVREVFEVMRDTPQHTYQVLTKRVSRVRQLSRDLPWPPNVWMGTTVEHNTVIERIDTLRLIPAAVRFLSLEPLLGPLPDLVLKSINWVIVGGESGPGARPMGREWAIDIKDKCLSSGVPFFFKQWGGVHRNKNGRLLEGELWEEMPSPDD